MYRHIYADNINIHTQLSSTVQAETKAVEAYIGEDSQLKRMVSGSYSLRILFIENSLV